MKSTLGRALGLSLLALLAACSDDEKKDEGCKPDDAASCEDGFVCEQLGSGETYSCLRPVIVSGRVFDALDAMGVAGATVVGLDANGAARTRVAETGADGTYELPVSVPRNEDGSPVQESITLRVAAADHQPFPLAPRSALPIELEKAVNEAEGDDADEAEASNYRIANAATDVSLIPLPMAERGGVTVSGTVSAEKAGGVLVLAVSAEVAQSSAVSDLDGAFRLFNVPVGSVTFEGYRAGLALEPSARDVTASGLSDVVLAASDAKLSTVEGSVNIVNAAGGSATSVILVAASTFDAKTARGEAPAGLRAADVGGAFSIADVPPGRYAVLAAFENDGLVRDPDTNIAGTEIVFVDVPASGGSVSLEQSFKVTGALGVTSPGADGVEKVSGSSVPLVWANDSSENGYELRVYDALGTLVLEELTLPSVSGGATVDYDLDTSLLEPGMLYQFRVLSYRDKSGERSYISATEDLRGVFELAR